MQYQRLGTLALTLFYYIYPKCKLDITFYDVGRAFASSSQWNNLRRVKAKLYILYTVTIARIWELTNEFEFYIFTVANIEHFALIVPRVRKKEKTLACIFGLKIESNANMTIAWIGEGNRSFYWDKLDEKKLQFVSLSLYCKN